MTFKTIIKAARLKPNDFPNASSIPIVLYDWKDRVIPGEDVIYARDLFLGSPAGKEKFLVFLEQLEEKPVSSMNVRIDAYNVVVFYKSLDVIFFSRKPLR